MSQRAFHYEQKRLENDFVALEPFDPAIHATRFVKDIKANPSLLTYVSLPIGDTTEDFIEFYGRHFGSSPEACIYVVFDKIVISKKGESDLKDNYAGTLALTSTSPVNACTEIGVMISPAFQRTHVATNAIGLLLLYTLDPLPAGGLGLRRVEWKTHAENAASRRAALRMGFEFEGVARWNRVFPGGEVVLPVEALEERNGTKGELPGRHTAIYSIVWDEWDEKRPKIVALMNLKR
ncbi:acyl-CoA N-acyltransferase [Lophium mytilinum]|uniref:Acyl-CoA N-acyltransferase n=1 Tax=Lophium mytilinum TaxID=390894 RepID=A0A6A6QGR7_9PEZI|nr:acyl-CoA N-acyltransferase [Lophium mytilinum]